MDKRYDGKFDIFEYTNIEGRGFPKGLTPEKYRHELEPERVEKILNTITKTVNFGIQYRGEPKKTILTGSYRKTVGKLEWHLQKQYDEFMTKITNTEIDVLNSDEG